jgi:hypothetical protein
MPSRYGYPHSFVRTKFGFGRAESGKASVRGVVILLLGPHRLAVILLLGPHRLAVQVAALSRP